MPKSGGHRIVPRSAKKDSKRLVIESSRKRKAKSTTSALGYVTSKKRRIVGRGVNKEKKLAEIIANFNLNVNELFQLREYKSIVYWNPSDYSSAASLSAHIPELYESFIKDLRYQLIWDNEIENQSELDQLPMRFQKKVIAEQEKKLSEKFPFKKDVINESRKIEVGLLESLESEDINGHIKIKSPRSRQSNNRSLREPLKERKSKPLRLERKVKDITVAEIKEEHKEKVRESDSDDEEIEDEEISPELVEKDIKSNFKLKSVKFSIPPPIVTHPSHIPSWRPDPNHSDSSLHDKHNEVIDFKPQPLQIVSTPFKSYTEPDVKANIQNFLNNYCRFPIIDETNTADYNNTPEEYERIMNQQESLLKKIYHKVMIEKSLELNGDKIERRKVVLPHTSKLKQISDPFRSSGSITPKVQGTANNLTFHDHFLHQGMAFSKVHQQMRKQHQLRTRKIAQMIEQHFKKKKGEKERLAREKEQNLKRISRMAAQAVKRRWSQAAKVYRYLQLEKEEELKKIRGREHLSQMLEHSTQLLEAQLNKSPRTLKEVGMDDNEDEGMSELDSDDHLSTSSEESENESQIDGKGTISKEENNDMSLSVDELRKKYADLDQSIEPSSRTGSSILSSDENEVEENGGIGDTQGLAALYSGKDIKIPASSITETDYTEEQKQLIKNLSKDGGENSILDSDSDTGSLSSDVSSFDESSESDEENDETKMKKGKTSGLASLFGNGSIEEDSSIHDSSSEEEYRSIDDEILSTTDEEDEPTTPKSVDQTMDKDSEKEAIEEVNGSMVRDVPLPSLLRGTLRPYQKQGLNWLASLYNNNTNGILADEMGLGKTIQTISLLAYLACEHHVWGPHLIIVPTSVMLNWEMEFKKFAPGFKVLTYYGSPQQRAQKRKGWNKPDAFHVCITSYQLVVHDHQSFKRRKWKYMILDEAHNIKNFRSARWRALLNFNTEHRLLLTGTPLQNNLMELWSLLYFLMPSSKVNQAMPDGFANLEDFQTWFGKPVDKILESASKGANGDIIDENESTTRRMDEETRNTVARLHQVLRPYLLRRLKKDVEKQMPGKYEHIVYCRLSKRQRFLYDDFMSRAKTKETLASGNFLSIINCLMQLRKVCNHPDLFEVRPIVTSFAMPKSVVNSFRSSEIMVRKALSDDSFKDKVNLSTLNLDIVNADSLNYFVAQSTNRFKCSKGFEEQISQLDSLIKPASDYQTPDLSNYLEYFKFLKYQEQTGVRNKLKHLLYLNNLRCSRAPVYGESLIKSLQSFTKSSIPTTDAYNNMIVSVPKRVDKMGDIIEKYSVITPSVVALDMKDQLIPISTQRQIMEEVSNNNIENPFHKSQVKLSIAFPDKSLLQYDCGKLQKLATLLQDLTSNGHRALIFTQMTKVLDILEQFLNIHGYRYMRLDGATKIEDRQLLTEKFNRDPKIPVFILSTRSGGLGINLTGADTVIFYDSDWNPAMDKQCQDRCHRIGQSRDVHIYRFVSEYTIESNILSKANQKRQLDNVVIQEGEFTTDYFGKFSVRDLVSEADIAGDMPDKPLDAAGRNVENVLAQAEDEDDRVAASVALKEVAIDEEDFNDESKSVTTEGTPSQTPAPEVPDNTANNAIVGNEELEDADYEEGVGHIDEYMLRFIADGYYWDC